MDLETHVSPQLQAAEPDVAAPAPWMLAALERTSHLAVVTDVCGDIVWVNREFERVTGYALSDARGRRPGALLQCDETDARTITLMRQAVNERRPFRGDVLNRDRNGRRHWLELDIHPLYDPDGRLMGFSSLQTDITERKQAEAALHAQEAILDNTGRLAAVGGLLFDLRLHELQWTRGTARLLGFRFGAEPTVQACLALFDGDAQQSLKAAIAEAVADLRRGDVLVRAAGRGHWNFELPLTTRDGRPKWVKLVAEILYDDGGPSQLVVAVQDITEQRAMKAELRRSVELLRGAIDAIDEAFVVFDPEDRLIYCNDRYRQVYATSADLMVEGQTFEAIVREGVRRGQYPAAVGREEAWLADRFKAHRSGNSMFVQTLDDGRVVRIIERHTPDGHTVGFRVDITEFALALQEAERANRAKGEFIGTVSHELRTPLQSVIGFSSLGRRFAAEDPRLGPMFNDIHEGGQRMLRLVNALLDVSKIDGTSTALKLVPCAWGDVVARVARELQPLADERGLQFVLPRLEPAVTVRAEAFRLEQVVRNVLANALRFAPAGSAIEVALQDLGADGRTLTVRDHGPGIPPDEIEHIFEAFAQSSRTRDGSGGTGLGLTICRKIMQSHGGRIAASNAHDGGALMQLWLPDPGTAVHSRGQIPLTSGDGAATE